MNSDVPIFPDPSDEDGSETKTGTPPRMPEPGTPQDIAAALASELKAGTYDEHSEQELGKGGMGRVLRATQRGLRREVALKRLLKNAEPMKQRFVWEARITGLLEHPSIVPVHEISVDVQGEVYYTMKLVQGITLLDILNSLRPELPKKEGESAEAFAARKDQRELLKKQHGNLAALLNIFQKLCDAISFAHAHPLRVIHRDLKPENIMVGDYGEVLVMDWGLAKVLNWKKAPAHLLVTPELPGEEAGENVSDAPQHSLPASQRGAYGTPGYAPPEMCDPELGEADERSDIYSLGAILHEILTLFPVSEGTTIVQRLEQTRTGQVALRLKHDQGKSLNVPHCPGGHVPQDMVPVVLKALKPHAKERMQSVAEVKQALTDYQNGFANAFQNAGAWTHFKYFVKRHRGVTAATLGAGVILAGVSGFYAWHLKQERDATEVQRQAAELRAAEVVHTKATAEQLINNTIFDLRKKLESAGNVGVLTESSKSIEEYYAKLPASLRTLDTDRNEAHALVARGLILFSESQNEEGLATVKKAMTCYESLFAKPDSGAEVRLEPIDLLLAGAAAAESPESEELIKKAGELAQEALRLEPANDKAEFVRLKIRYTDAALKMILPDADSQLEAEKILLELKNPIHALAMSHRENWEYRDVESEILGQLGILLLTKADKRPALRYLVGARRILQEVVEEDPGTDLAERLTRFGLLETRIAEGYSAQGLQAQSLHHFKVAVDLFEKARSSVDTLKSFIMEEAYLMALISAGNTARERFSFDTAREMLWKAREVNQSLLQRMPDSEEWLIRGVRIGALLSICRFGTDREEAAQGILEVQECLREIQTLEGRGLASEELTEIKSSLEEAMRKYRIFSESPENEPSTTPTTEEPQ